MNKQAVMYDSRHRLTASVTTLLQASANDQWVRPVFYRPVCQ